MSSSAVGTIREIVRLQDERLSQFRSMRLEAEAAGETPEPLGLVSASLMLPLFANPESSYYRDASLLRELEEALALFLQTQLPSGCISLVNCNIDSPPDTAFSVHLAALLYQIVDRSGMDELSGARVSLLLFLERAKPCLLNGGIHTPNHRWVMAGAFAKIYEIFGGEAFRERAFQFLDEGLDITDYGEWTERSNAIYNGACAIHLYDVGLIFGYEPAFAAIRSNLNMMQYMLHPDDSIVTEYSGRQDYGRTMMMDDWYYAVCHLMATRDRSPLFGAMAGVAAKTAPLGAHALIFWMLYPEQMNALDLYEPLSDDYTILLGEENEVPVPKNVPYLGKLVQHPHGASVLRHRKGKISVTAMAGQPELLHIRYGKAVMHGLKIGAGWFGIGAVAFPSIKKVGEQTYRMEVELEGCYWGPLPKRLTAGTNGMYVKMPNHLREKTNVQFLPVALEITMLENGVDVRVLSESIPNIYLQTVCMFDAKGELSGRSLKEAAPAIVQLTDGDAVFSMDEDAILISTGAHEHADVSMRNDPINRDALNLTVNWVTPTDKTLRIRFR
ncbi:MULTISPECIES: hypothetical protein [Cohnella]|uniref:Heparinase II/III-like protein n=1 Tax=Cohnella phaseoli TaxID=456490 RepID=A0A3D9JS73_9BACL|nr:hypothetical protein [Cohnella phaseoli]RED76884.1 hypothetical protein DFP98_110103 [Cohnella phaseoli]